MTHIVTCGLDYCLLNMDVEDNTTQIYGPVRYGRSTMDSVRETERAVQSFAVQPSLLRRMREPNLDLGGRRVGCLSQPANDCTALFASLALSIASCSLGTQAFMRSSVK